MVYERWPCISRPSWKSGSHASDCSRQIIAIRGDLDMLRRQVAAALTLLFFIFCLSTSGIAQTVTGTLSGSIVDTAGAVVPNASVTARNRETAATRTAT